MAREFDIEQDVEQTIIAPPLPEDTEAVKVAEKDVPVEWNIGDVILGLYEVKRGDYNGKRINLKTTTGVRLYC
jgi:hypothetical protein